MPKIHRHRWLDKTAPLTFCLTCGCDRAMADADASRVAEGKEPLHRMKLTRAGRDYAGRGFSVKGRPMGQGLCDRTWPENWIPNNAPVGYVTPAGDIKEAV